MSLFNGPKAIERAVERAFHLRLIPKLVPTITTLASRPRYASNAATTTVKNNKAKLVGIGVRKSENHSEWYSQVITKAEMIEYYAVSGCYVLRPWAYSIWESIQRFFDAEIKKLGVRNCYFPMFVSQAALEREKAHIADFSPEVAWVTRAGDEELARPVAIRPTSETVMYPSFAKWCHSHRDLPIKLNQWCNAVRWESKNPTPFLRTREFLWQEGHTAYASAEEAEKEVFDILDIYSRVYTDLLAIPVVKGRKSEKEKFAGADFSTTVEAYVPVNGRGLQGATAHHLGQDFSKLFDISFQDPEQPDHKLHAWQNSWGMSTRTIGAMVMIHGDDNGLVLPPRVASAQVMVIPVGITVKTSEVEKKKLLDKAAELTQLMVDGGIRAEIDLRDHVTPGSKFNHWELKGVPVRVELGPKDLAQNQVMTVARLTGEKNPLPMEGLVSSIKLLLERIHHKMYTKVEEVRNAHTKVCTQWEEFTPLLDEKHMVLSPFCGRPACEERIRAESTRGELSDNKEQGTSVMGAKTLCIPLEQPKGVNLPVKCINPHCRERTNTFALFGRSY